MSSAIPNHVENQDVVQYLPGAAPEEQTELLDRLVGLPAKPLQYRSYSLDLAGVASSGSTETIGSYALREAAN
jgi:hypothetical protein